MPELDLLQVCTANTMHGRFSCWRGVPFLWATHVNHFMGWMEVINGERFPRIRHLWISLFSSAR